MNNRSIQRFMNHRASPASNRRYSRLAVGAKRAVVLFSCALVSAALAQQDFSKVEIKATHVAGNIYMLDGAGGNIGVSIGPDGLLIVDDQFAPLAGKIDEARKQLGQGKLKFVLNTHLHGDHTGGNAYFGKQAPIIAHTNVRKRLNGADVSVQGGLPILMDGKIVGAIGASGGTSEQDGQTAKAGAESVK